jgi:preprotein translocase subunit SecE
VGEASVATSKKSKSATKVTRITASDSAKASKKPAKKPVVSKPAVTKAKKETLIDDATVTVRRKPGAGIIDYFKGAWSELKQVRWPDRRSTWGMTGALLLFTLFFVVIILVLDFGFSQLFKVIMGSN